MSKMIVFVIIITLVIGYLVFSRKNKMQINAPQTINLTSSVFKNNEFVPVEYTCDGVNVNPPLNIANVPEMAKSLVLVIDDPDSPAGTFTHWLVWNIDPNIKEIKENSIPEGAIEGITTWGSQGYGGPCPQARGHRYFFKILALDEKLNILFSADINQVMKAVENHVLAQGELVGKYSRNN